MPIASCWATFWLRAAMWIISGPNLAPLCFPVCVRAASMLSAKCWAMNLKPVLCRENFLNVLSGSGSAWELRRRQCEWLYSNWEKRWTRMPPWLRDDLSSSSPGLRLRLHVRQECTLDAGEKMAFQQRHANGARRAFIINQHKGTIGPALQSHLRHDRNSQTCADHCQYAAELAALKHHPGDDTGALAGGKRRLTKAVIIAQEQERFIPQLLQ